MGVSPLRLPPRIPPSVESMYRRAYLSNQLLRCFGAVPGMGWALAAWGLMGLSLSGHKSQLWVWSQFRWCSVGVPQLTAAAWSEGVVDGSPLLGMPFFPIVT